MQSKVSMVVPCYNKVKYIGEMLQSVYDQKWDNIELILVNNGSTDGTREIIGQWEPKFRERGYEVIIVDQENQGVAVAVRNGMLRMSGEYFCSVDCDDSLDPEYVSTMAGWLEKHPVDDSVICNISRSVWDFENAPGLKKSVSPEMCSRPKLLRIPILESQLLGCVSTGVWTRMTRVECIRRCKVVENFTVVPNCLQESQINIPLAAYGTRTTHIPHGLYHYYKNETSVSNFSTFEQAKVAVENGFLIIRATVDTLDIPDKEKHRLISMSEIASKHFLTLYSLQLSGHEAYWLTLAEEMPEIINKCFSPSPNILSEHIKLSGWWGLYRAVSNNITGHKNECLTNMPSRIRDGRIIGYAALGKAAKYALPFVVNTPLRPDMLWDLAAGADTTHCGIPIMKPDFEKLTENDTVLVFLKDMKMARQVYDSLTRSKVENCLYFYDILDYLAAYYYPMIENDCEFIG